MATATKTYPAHLGENGTEQFTITTWLNGEKLREQKIHDPFIRTTVRLRGLRHAWNALTRGIVINISLDGSEGVSRAIMTLDPYKLTADTKEIIESRRRYWELRAAGQTDGICSATTKL